MSSVLRSEHRDGLGRPVAAVLRTLMRPGTYVGTAREVAIGAFSLATYPLGISQRHAADPVSPVPRRRTLRAVGDNSPEWTPIILVHGYVHNRSAFLAMGRALRRHGFESVHTMNYNPLTTGIAELAQQLADEVARVREATGADKVHLVGHSMGGIIARTYVQTLGGDKFVDTVITLGSPHRGTYAAHLGMGHAARDLRPGSALMRTLEETARPNAVRWIAYYSDLDAMVVPASSGKLVHPALQAVNIRMPNTGHLSLLVQGDVLRGIVANLSDTRLGRPVGARHPRRRISETA